MAYLIFQIDDLTAEEQADLRRATSFTLEAHNRCDRFPAAYSIEGAHDHGRFNIHLGFEDGSEIRSLFIAAVFGEAISTLAILQEWNPGARLLLSCDKGEAEIDGPDVCRGIVAARASLDHPYDPDQDWSDFAKAIAVADATDGRLHVNPEENEVFWEVESYLLGHAGHTFHLPPAEATAMAAKASLSIAFDSIEGDPDHDVLLCGRRQRVRIGDGPGLDMNCQTALNIDPGSASNFDPPDEYGGTPLISPAKRVGVAQPG